MANPNDIARKLVDTSEALQSLSNQQRKTVELSVSSFLNIKELIDKNSVLSNKLELAKDKSKSLLVSTETELFNKRKDFYSKFLVTFSAADKLLDKTKINIKSLSKGYDAPKPIQNKVTPTQDITKDNTNAFLRTDDNPQEHQIELLKSINDKISKLSNPTSGGLFDFLINGLPKIISSLGTAGMDVAGGAAGGGILAGIASKYKGLLKLPRLALGTRSKYAVRLATRAAKRNPIASLGIAGVLALGGGLAFGASVRSDAENDDSNPQSIDQRAKGGKVNSKTPYVVGENGPELFVPDSSGIIHPKLMSGGISLDVLKSFMSDQSRSMDNAISKSFGIFTKPFDKSMKKYSASVGGKMDSFVKIFEDGWTFLSNGIKEIVDKIKSLISGGSNVIKEIVDKIKSLVLGGSNTPPTTGTSSASQPAGSAQAGTPQQLPAQQPAGPQPAGSAQAGTPQQLPAQQPAGPQPQGTPQSTTPQSKNTPANVPQNYSGAFEVPETGIRKVHNGEMIVPAYQSEMVRAASELKNNYSIASAQPSRTNKITEDFWMKTFVPAFAQAIKVDTKKEFKTRMIDNSVNPFG